MKIATGGGKIKIGGLRGLVGHWTMSQDSLKSLTILADKTPYGNDGTIYGATFAADRKGKANSAMSFDGVDDYIDVNGNDTATQSKTISCWIKLNEDGVDLATSQPIINYGFLRVYDRASNNQIQIRYDRSGSAVAATGTIGNGNRNWHHIVGQYYKEDSTNYVKIYIDGVLIQTSTDLVDPASNYGYTIGSYNNAYFNGSLADVRIYNRVLSAEEIKLLYESYNPNINIGNYFIDSRDGNRYKIVQIGNQIWMAENLKYLPSVSPSNVGSEINPFYYVYGYQGTDVLAAKATDNYKTYGVLYNWPAAMNGQTGEGVQGICPTGWHLPTDAEFTTLTNTTGNSKEALISAGWFNNLFAGYRDTNSSFYGLGSRTHVWSSSASSSSNAWWRYLYASGSTVYRNNYSKAYGWSVRCLRD